MWLGFFLKFWIVSVFLQKPLAWFAKFYLRVQSKNWGRNNFLIFFSEIFRILSEKFFRLLSKKLQEVFRTTFYVSRGTVCGLNFFKSFESIWIFCRNLWHSSQTSIFVSKVKIPEEIIFLIFFLEFFRILSKKFFRLLAKKLQEVFRTTLYVSRGTVCGLNFFKSFESIWIFCRNLWHSSQTSIFVSKVKIPEEIIFLIFFLEFLRILGEKFFRLLAEKIQEVFKTTFYVSTGTVCGLDFS